MYLWCFLFRECKKNLSDKYVNELAYFPYAKYFKNLPRSLDYNGFFSLNLSPIMPKLYKLWIWLLLKCYFKLSSIEKVCKDCNRTVFIHQEAEVVDYQLIIDNSQYVFGTAFNQMMNAITISVGFSFSKRWQNSSKIFYV